MLREESSYPSDFIVWLFPIGVRNASDMRSLKSENCASRPALLKIGLTLGKSYKGASLSAESKCDVILSLPEGNL